MSTYSRLIYSCINFCILILLFIFPLNAHAKMTTTKINTEYTCTYIATNPQKYAGYLPSNNLMEAKNAPININGSSIELYFNYDNTKKQYKVTAYSDSFEQIEGFRTKDIIVSYKDDNSVVPNNTDSIYIPITFVGSTGMCPKRISLATYCEDGYSSYENETISGTSCSRIKPYILLRNDDENNIETNPSLNNNKFYHSVFKDIGAGRYNHIGYTYGENITNNFMRNDYILRTFIDNPKQTISKSKEETDATIEECCNSSYTSSIAHTINPYSYACDAKFGDDYYEKSCKNQDVTLVFSYNGEYSQEKKFPKFYLDILKESEYSIKGIYNGFNIPSGYELENWYKETTLKTPFKNIEFKAGEKYTLYLKVKKIEDKKEENPSKTDGKVDTNGGTGKIFNKQCEYYGKNLTTEAEGPVYFYESYNWVYSLDEKDPVHDDIQLIYDTTDSTQVVDQLNASVGKWTPIRQSSFAKKFYIFDNFSKEIEKYVNKNYKCNRAESVKDTCPKTYRDKFKEMASLNSMTPYEYLKKLISDGAFGNDWTSSMSATVDLKSSGENSCITYDSKPWSPDKFYGCQVTSVDLGESGVFSIFNNDNNVAIFYLFSSKEDMEMICPSGATAEKDKYTYRYEFTDKKDPYVYRLPQDVELSCTFEQDFFKSNIPFVKATTDVLKNLKLIPTSETATFSYVFTKEGDVKFHPAKGVSDLGIKFVFNKDQIMNLYSVKSETNILELGHGFDFVLYTTDLSKIKDFIMADLALNIAVGVGVTIAATVVAHTVKLPPAAAFALNVGKKVVQVVALGASIINITEMLLLYTNRENRTVILTNYMNFSDSEYKDLKEKFTTNGIPYFEKYNLSSGTNGFKCTVKPYKEKDKLNFTGNDKVTCGIFDKNTMFGKVLRTILNIIRTIAIIILILFGIMDFVKAITSSDEDALKKAGNTFVKRLIIIVLILFIPAIIELLFSLIDKESCVNKFTN